MCHQHISIFLLPDNYNDTQSSQCHRRPTTCVGVQEDGGACFQAEFECMGEKILMDAVRHRVGDGEGRSRECGEFLF